ncbi:MAG: flagellar assembly protein FliW [Lachnospiraceae bacterium]|nr:flagellar assembly protein FliW [Lachnospiraceae bacterium]
MEFTSKLFGRVDVDEEKVIEFPNGIIGYPDYRRFTLMYDIDKSIPSGLNFLVSLDEPAFLLPVVTALMVKPGYSPIFSEDVQAVIGKLDAFNALLLVTMTIPEDITKMTVNLNAPIVINTDTKKAIQSMVENKDYDIKYPIYDFLKN